MTAPADRDTPGLDRIAPARRPTGPPVMYQRWRDLLFLHWEVDADQLAATIAPGLELDTFEGRAYVGLVPFTMRDVRPRGLPAVPWLSHFHELNVRTYVHYQGVPGVWFQSLDAANPVAVRIARGWFKLPYFHARMRMTRGPVAGDDRPEARVRYTSSRLWPGPRGARADIDYRAGSGVRRAEPGTLDFFFLERYVLYSSDDRGRIYRGRVHHVPYPIRDAELLSLDEDLIAAAGLDRPDAPPLVHYSDGVDVEVFPLERTG